MVEDCPETVTLPGPVLRNVKHENNGDNSEDNGEVYQDDYAEDMFNIITIVPKNPKLQARSRNGQKFKTWVHYIAAEEITWDYAPHLKLTDR